MKIFVASTGRCGTTFMTSVFNHLTNIPSFHEPRPKGKGQTLEELNSRPPYSQRTLKHIEEKLEFIRENSVNGNYFESNNYFIRSFVKVILDTFDDVYCIYLRRNLFDLLASFANRYSEHGFRKGYQLDPTQGGNCLTVTGGMGYFETVMWNYFEVRERFYFLRNRFVKTYEFDFKDINNLEEWYRMFDYFGIPTKKIKAFPCELKRNKGTRIQSLEDAARIIRSV